MGTRTIERNEGEEGCLEQLQVVETGWGPKGETALLMDVLKRSLGLAECLADPTEVLKGDNPLVSLNHYKHRLHALRCDYADARLRGIELEEQLAEANLRILRLEARVTHLDTTLEQIYASRFWKIKEHCARCWRAVFRRFPNRTYSERASVQDANHHASDG